MTVENLAERCASLESSARAAAAAADQLRHELKLERARASDLEATNRDLRVQLEEVLAEKQRVGECVARFDATLARLAEPR